MGEVYRAHDAALARDVALKVLPDAFALNPESLIRFRREAQVLAALNHPNIAAIYGVEEGHGTRALVLELVEGPTLADRVVHGPIPLDEALAIAFQIGEALDAAHSQGVVHRDLKPSNIKVRADGTVKVLDFGLAKAFEPSASLTPDSSQSPTLISPTATRMGVIMGTAAYMSPEQARGRPVDKRADVWAFGCVVYEMLVGTRAFDGDDVSETIARVIEREPDWNALAAVAPPPVVRVVRRCLQKDPKRRLRDVADAVLELRDAIDTGSSANLPADRSPRQVAVNARAHRGGRDCTGDWRARRLLAASALHDEQSSRRHAASVAPQHRNRSPCRCAARPRLGGGRRRL